MHKYRTQHGPRQDEERRARQLYVGRPTTNGIGGALMMQDCRSLVSRNLSRPRGGGSSSSSGSSRGRDCPVASVIRRTVASQDHRAHDTGFVAKINCGT